MLLVKIKDKQAEIWDPLPDARRTRDREIQVNSILHLVDAILHAVVDATYSVSWSFLSFVVTHGEGVPRQSNGFDCGVYVIKFMDTPGIITNKSYIHDSQNVRVQLALQLIDSPFNEQRDQLLTLANAHYSNAATYINESKLASTVKARNVSTRKGHKNSCTKRRFRQKV